MIYCILPAYNEEKSVSQQMRSLKGVFEKGGLDYKILVVNDGSTDRTGEEVQKLKETANVSLLTHEVNSGPGVAFKSGFEFILPQLRDDDVVITMDCDNTLQLDALELMMEKIGQGYDLALGSIFVRGGRLVGVPFLRKVMSHGASLFYRAFFPVAGVRDYTAFYRAMRGSVLKSAYEKYGNAMIQTRGFGCMAEMLINLRRLNLSIAEVPMTVRYDLKTSRSKLKVLKTVKEHFGIIRRNFFYSRSPKKGLGR